MTENYNLQYLVYSESSATSHSDNMIQGYWAGCNVTSGQIYHITGVLDTLDNIDKGVYHKSDEIILIPRRIDITKIIWFETPWGESATFDKDMRDLLPTQQMRVKKAIKAYNKNRKKSPEFCVPTLG